MSIQSMPTAGHEPHLRPSLGPRAAFAGVEQFAPLVGRILLSTIFLISGVMKVVGWNETEGMMASMGMPAVPLFHVGAILVELGAGLGVLLGCQARVSALVLFLFLIPTTLIFHAFWAYEGAQQQMQMINFLKNLAIMGGLALVVGFGAGPFSIDRRRK